MRKGIVQLRLETSNRMRIEVVFSQVVSIIYYRNIIFMFCGTELMFDFLVVNMVWICREYSI